MKKFTFKGVLDGFRSSVSTSGGPGGNPGNKSYEQDINEILKPEHFNVTKTFCHGFPYQPTAMAYDPVQRLLVIGTKNGSLRILGRPGVDIQARHDPESGAVLHLQFVWNEGTLVTATADDSIHLWNFRSSKKPAMLQSLKFQRERITCLHLPFQSKWLCVGTERGNVHVVNTDTFQLSGYIINWNKTIEISRKTHPGPVLYLGENPTDPSKLLIGYETGCIVLWDFRNKCPELRFQAHEPLRSASWHSDGKQFMTSHSDGSLLTWNLRQTPPKPVSTTWPHSRTTKDGKPEPCKTIPKVEWKSSKTGDNFVIFSGGLTVDRAGRTPSLTVIHGKTTTVLEMEHIVLDFVVLCESQWESECQDPYAIVVLLQQDLVVIDLLTPGYPCFENPYPMDIHESPVTCCIYLADCPGDLIPAFYSVGSKTQKKTGFSDNEWPINGGQWGSTSCSYAEIIVSGHADGSLKFWDGSSTNLQALYKLKTSKPFERPKRGRSTESADDDPFAVQHIFLCPESRYLAIAGASSQVLLFKFKKHEHSSETPVLEIPIIYEVEEDWSGPNFDFAKLGDPPGGGSKGPEYFNPIRVKSGPQKKSPGYQAELVCLTPWVNGEPPGPISALAINSSYGLMSYGNESGLVVVDIFQKICLLNMGTPDLYGTSDPYQRAPRSPKRPDLSDEKSPTDQVVDLVDLTPNNTPVEEPSPSSSTSTVEHNKEYFSEAEAEKPLETELPKCKSTTPTKRTRRHTWSQVKVLIKKSLGEKKLQQQQQLAAEMSSKPESVDPNRSPSPPSSSDDTSPGDNATELRVPRPTDLPIPPTRSKKKSSTSSTTSTQKKSSSASKKSSAKCMDLRGTIGGNIGGNSGGGGASNNSSLTGLMKKIHKLDSTFARSRSSSMSSLDNITSEAIQSLAFMDSLSKRNDYSTTYPCLWVGTSLGSILIISIILPPPGDSRKTDRVSVSPSGTIFRLKGSILSMSFLDCNGILIPGSNEPWKDEAREPRAKTPTKTLSAGQSPTQSLDSGNTDRQFAVLVSEKQSRVVALPSQTCIHKQQLCENSFVVKANVTTIKDSVCLVCYLSSGNLAIYSLPSLRLLLDVPFVPLSDLSFLQQTRKSAGGGGNIVDPMLSIWGQQLIVSEDANQIAKTFCLSSYGHGMYMSSPSEMMKFTISDDFYQIMDSMLGDLYLEVEMPERPKEGFFTGLFGGGVRNLDREELFGETSSGRGARSVAKVIPGPAGAAAGSTQQQMDHLQMRSGTVAGDVSRARMLLVERGDKLGQLDDKTAKMMSDAENFSSAAHQLMLKYKDKKWYQL